jgi:hypothetical protein
MGRTACTEPQCLYSRAIPLLPYGPYGLYRASLRVQGCTLPLLAVSKGLGSSVGIPTTLQAGRFGDRFPVGERFSSSVQTGPGAHPASCTMSTVSFPGVKSGRWVTLTPGPLLVPLVMKEWSYTSTPLMGPTACTELQWLYKGAFYLLLLVYFRR